MKYPITDIAVICDFGLGRRTDDICQVVPGRQGGPSFATALEIKRGESHDYAADTYSFSILVWDLTLLYMRRHGKKFNARYDPRDDSWLCPVTKRGSYHSKRCDGFS